MSSDLSGIKNKKKAPYLDKTMSKNYMWKIICFKAIVFIFFLQSSLKKVRSLVLIY